MAIPKHHKVLESEVRYKLFKLFLPEKADEEYGNWLSKEHQAMRRYLCEALEVSEDELEEIFPPTVELPYQLAMNGWLCRHINR